MNIAILCSWNLEKSNSRFYIGGTHFSYLLYLAKNFRHVYLISSVKNTDKVGDLSEINQLDNIEVVELPPVYSYLGAIKNYKAYCRAIEYVKPLVDFIYCRVPDPFCWLPQLKYKMPSIMHYVGDTIDATKHNVKWSMLKKSVMIAGYMPDYFLTLRASKKATVYTNGSHLCEKLKAKNIHSTAVISSTVSENDLHDPEPFRSECPPKMIYLGYLRYAKGMDLLKKLWIRLKEKYPDFIFGVIGNGELELDLKEFIEEKGLSDNVIMYGRINDRKEINRLLRQADIFVFPSLSEGSPRVVIESMAEGVPVISTPVGSLPGTFNDGETIRFFDFNDDAKAFQLIESYCLDPLSFEQQRDKAFRMVKERFTKEKFLSQVFFINN